MNGISDGVGQALLLYRSGDLEGAKAQAELALADHPDSAALLQLLGIIHCRGGDLGQGAAHLRRSFELEPGDQATRLALANALLALGRADEAEALCGPDADGGGMGPPLWRLRGYILQMGERFEEAARCYEKVVERDPNDWEIWNNLGNARRSSGDVAGAIPALEHARSLRADLPAIHFNLAMALAQTGRLGEAARGFAEALRLAPDNFATLVELGKTLRYLGRFEEALPLLTRADRLAPGTAEVALERGRAFAGLRRFDEAELGYREALKHRPGLADAFLERGLLLERNNRLERLGELLEEAAAQSVDPAALSHLRALALDRDGKAAEALAAARAAPAAGEPVRRALLIGRLADKAGEPAIAFEAYAEMNRLVAEGDPTAVAEAPAYRAHIAGLIAMLTPDFVASWSRFDGHMASARPSPVFLVGFPRSGTTLLDTMLMGHPAVHVLEEVPILQQVGDALGDFARLPELGADEIGRLRSLYFEALDEAAPAAGDRMIIDKLPLNIAGAPLIHRLFPDAKLIFAQRHPCDVALSCFMQNFELNAAMANFLDLGDAARLYDLVLALWTRSRELFPLDVHTLRYEALVEDMEAELRPLLDFLGLAWDEKVLDHPGTAAKRGPIVTPSYAQVAEPIYARASGRWERYCAQMEGVLPILLPWAERLGYGRGGAAGGKSGL